MVTREGGRVVSIIGREAPQQIDEHESEQYWRNFKAALLNNSGDVADVANLLVQEAHHAISRS